MQTKNHRILGAVALLIGAFCGAQILAARAPLPGLDAPLPIVEVPARDARGDVLAIMISGDGGWAGIDRGVSKALAARDVAVIGLDSSRYFRSAHSPEQIAADVGRLMEFYSSRWHKSRVVLIGYSFGADVMPAVLNRLPSAARARVASVDLLGLGPTANFQLKPSRWLPGRRPDGVPVMPEVARFDSLPVLCIEGAGEKNTLCPQLQRRGIDVRQIGKGHHFSHLDAQIADAIIAEGIGAPV